MKDNFSKGSKVKCFVRGKGKNNFYNLTMIGESDGKYESTLYPLILGSCVVPHVGDSVTASFQLYKTGCGFSVDTPYGRGRVDITDISDCYQKSPLSMVSKSGDYLK